MNTESVEKEILSRIKDELGDEISDLRFYQSVHIDFVKDIIASKVVGRVPAKDIFIETPATKLDMIKCAMPRFIRRIFPPKFRDVIKFIAFIPGEYTKRKVVAWTYLPDEIEKDGPVFVDYMASVLPRVLRECYTNVRFNTWLP